MKKQIGVSHLVYIIIIFVIVLAFVLIITFGGSSKASTMIGTASTVSSLILSVIAIVLSLLDVAGQRESIVDLKETAEKLNESNQNSAALVQQLIVKLSELDDWREDVVKLAQDLKEKDNVKSEDLELLYKKVNEKPLSSLFAGPGQLRVNNLSDAKLNLGLAGLAAKNSKVNPSVQNNE